MSLANVSSLIYLNFNVIARLIFEISRHLKNYYSRKMLPIFYGCDKSSSEILFCVQNRTYPNSFSITRKLLWLIFNTSKKKCLHHVPPKEVMLFKDCRKIDITASINFVSIE